MSSDQASPHAIWNSLNEVERTGLGVAYMRWQGSKQRTWPDGTPWYSDPCGQFLVEKCIPAEEQQKMGAWSSQQHGRMFDFTAVRTAELDTLINTALIDSNAPAIEEPRQAIRQMVIIGAGLDTRAWRMSWPPRFKIYEVDRPAVLQFKSRVVSGPTSKQHQQQNDSNNTNRTVHSDAPVLQCERVEVAADASNAQALWGQLVASGLNAERPMLWLLEGFIGYITSDAGNKLLSLLAQRSAPGSKIIMTAPPTPDIHAEVAASFLMTKLCPAWAPKVLKAAVHACLTKGIHWLMKLGVLKQNLGGPKLHHSTTEHPTNTLKRLPAAGWKDCELLTSQHMAAKYGVDTAQPILLGKT